MTIYCKLDIKHKILLLPPVEKDGIINYNLDIPRLIADGYKLFVEAEYPEEPINRKNHIEYEETETEIREVIIWEETQEEADERIAQEEKERKTQEINNKITELNIMLINELRKGNKENIDVYNEVISGLEEMRDNL